MKDKVRVFFNRVFSSYSHPCKCGTILCQNHWSVAEYCANEKSELKFIVVDSQKSHFQMAIHHIKDFWNLIRDMRGNLILLWKTQVYFFNSLLYPYFSTWNCDTEAKHKTDGGCVSLRPGVVTHKTRQTDRPECGPAVLWVDHEATFTGEHGSPPRQPLPADPIHPILLQTQWQLTVGVLKRS